MVLLGGAGPSRCVPRTLCTPSDCWVSAEVRAAPVVVRPLSSPFGPREGSSHGNRYTLRLGHCRRRSNARPVAPVENWATVVVSLCRVVGSG